MTVSGCAISGGGVGIDADGLLTVSGVTISGSQDAGIDVVGSAASTVSESAISGNPGDGVYIDGSVLTINDSTIAENGSGGGEESGGIQVTGTLAVNDSTVAFNYAGENGGGGIDEGYQGGAISLVNTIVADNTNYDSQAPDISGSVTASGSLIRSTAGADITNSASPAWPNIVNQDPSLAPFGYYGGPTMPDGAQNADYAAGAGEPCHRRRQHRRGHGRRPDDGPARAAADRGRCGGYRRVRGGHDPGDCHVDRQHGR